MRISDWSSDVCSSDLSLQSVELIVHVHLSTRPGIGLKCVAKAQLAHGVDDGVQIVRLGAVEADRSRRLQIARDQPVIAGEGAQVQHVQPVAAGVEIIGVDRRIDARPAVDAIGERSEEHTSELQSLMRISYAVFCLTNKHTL